MRYILRETRAVVAPLDLERELNEAQRAVVCAGTGPLLVLAGAGTGKTRTLTFRAAHLMASGLDPRHLMLCTFTNRAAREMVRRVESLSGVELRTLWAGTFHHLANLVLRRYAEQVGLTPGYAILDREDARDLMASCLAEQGPALHARRFPRAPLLLHLASSMVNRRIDLEHALRQEAPQFYELTEAITPVLSRYATRKQALGLVDYDDLLQLWWRLLVECPGPRAELIDRFHHVLVDEYQDTNRLQGEIVDICGSAHGNLTVVGDDAQSIYAFRGAHLENMLDFPRRHPGAQIFKLEANYRSVPEILHLANKSIRNNTRQYPKQLHAVRASGALPVLVRLHDVYQQAAFVAQRVLELHHEHDTALHDMVVLYRAHAHSLELQLELTRRQIPFVVRSGLRLFEQAHIKDVIAFLRVVHNPRDPLAWQRVLRTWPGMGRRSAERILGELLRRSTAPAPPTAPPTMLAAALPDEALATPAALLRVPELQTAAGRAFDRAAAQLAALFDRMPVEAGVPALIQTVLEAHYRDHLESTYPNAATRLEDLTQLAEYGRRYDTLEQFLSELSLVAGFAAEGTGLGQAPDDALTLSTVHQAKGLEWPVVLLIGLAEGRFPGPLAVRTPSELEEERRLFYVAATRARDQLYLCQPRFEEPDQGPRRLLRLSRFVAELSEDGVCPYEPWEVETC